jgi:hypothetical protein
VVVGAGACRVWDVASAAHIEPPQKGLEKETKEKGCHCITLKCTAVDVDLWCVSVWRDVDCGGESVELFACGDE